MRVSIITVSYNSEQTIARTLESVLKQKYLDIEYLVVDGKSNDSTVAIAESFSPKFKEKNISYSVHSEPDKGIYDAYNKGIQMASGDIIGILNSDDYYASDDALERIVRGFAENKTETVYGNILYVKGDKPYRYWKAGKPRGFKYGWMPPHTAFFVKKSVYEKLGLFRLDCGINADYELMLRFLEKNKVSSSWLDFLCTCMEAGGASNSGIKSRIEGITNDTIAWEKNSIEPLPFTILFKKIRKLPQFVMAKLIHF